MFTAGTYHFELKPSLTLAEPNFKGIRISERLSIHINHDHSDGDGDSDGDGMGIDTGMEMGWGWGWE